MGRLRTVARFLLVAWSALPLLATYARDRRRFFVVGRPRRPTIEEQSRRAQRLLETLLALGPTYIKLGQLLSTRPDILPPPYIDALSKLQDEVPPAPWDETAPVIEEELGPIDDVFSSFDTEAISGASLGQVYEAEIDGQRVAVKVRRPGVADLVAVDLRVIRWWVRLLLPFVDDVRAFSLRNIADEFGSVITQEMDYRREATVLEEIRENFADEPDVIIPRLIADHSTDRVLTMEYVSGTKITAVETLDRQGLDRSAIAEQLERAYLKMVLEDGVFHADPHPGNIAVTPDGRLVFYDFGMSGQIDATDRRRIIDFYVAAGERDIERVIDALVELGTLRADVDRRVMADVLELAIRDASGEEIETWRVQQLIERLEGTMYEFPLRLPARLALVMRVATVVEGVCVTLDPDFDFIAVATSYLGERGYREETVKRAIRDTGRAAGEAGLAGIRALPVAERVLNRIDRDNAYVRVGVEDPRNVLASLALRLVYGLIAGAGIIAAAIIYSFRGLETSVGVPIVVVAIALVLLYRSVRRRRGIRARPTFTRYQLRHRDEE